MMRAPFSLRLATMAAALAPALVLVGCGSAPTKPVAEPAPHSGPGARPRQEPGVPVLPPAGSGRGGYYQDDGPGENPPPNLMATPDAEVRLEPPLPRANKEYVVFGKIYRPITDPNAPFMQRGLGTWYGKKFHGQRTSSGELYDMYKMTAAHPTLPIPSYARVTSLDTGNQVVVRINDRGPFHSTRVIDVSYTAALKLGLLAKGSHELEVVRILPAEVERMLADGKKGNAPAVRVAVQPAAPARQSAAATRPAAQTAALLYPAPPGAGAAAEGAMEGAVVKAAPLVLQPSAPSSLPAPTVMLAGGSGAPVAAKAAEAAPDAVANVAAAAEGVAAVPTIKGGFYLQLGSYSRAENAEAARAKLALDSGLQGLAVVPAGGMQRLFSGPYTSRQEARQAIQALPAALGLKPLVIQR